MILGIWKNIKMYCPNHEQPIEFVPREGETTFYGCPKYFKQDEKHPDGWDENDHMCLNRLNFNDAQDIVAKLSETIEGSLVSGEMIDFTNYTFDFKYYTVRVLKYSPKDMEIKLSIVNKSSPNRQS